MAEFVEVRQRCSAEQFVPGRMAGVAVAPEYECPVALGVGQVPQDPEVSPAVHQVRGQAAVVGALLEQGLFQRAGLPHKIEDAPLAVDLFVPRQQPVAQEKVDQAVHAPFQADLGIRQGLQRQRPVARRPEGVIAQRLEKPDGGLELSEAQGDPGPLQAETVALVPAQGHVQQVVRLGFGMGELPQFQEFVDGREAELGGHFRGRNVRPQRKIPGSLAFELLHADDHLRFQSLDQHRVRLGNGDRDNGFFLFHHHGLRRRFGGHGAACQHGQYGGKGCRRTHDLPAAFRFPGGTSHCGESKEQLSGRVWTKVYGTQP